MAETARGHKTADMRAEFDGLTQQLNRTFNVKVVEWDDFDMEKASSETIERMPHIIAELERLWGTVECQAYLHKLLRDNRDGTRQGFPLAVIDDILCLLGILNQHLGAYREATRTRAIRFRPRNRRYTQVCVWQKARQGAACMLQRRATWPRGLTDVRGASRLHPTADRRRSQETSGFRMDARMRKRSTAVSGFTSAVFVETTFARCSHRVVEVDELALQAEARAQVLAQRMHAVTLCRMMACGQVGHPDSRARCTVCSEISPET